jgi:hypothetical protein
MDFPHIELQMLVQGHHSSVVYSREIGMVCRMVKEGRGGRAGTVWGDLFGEKIKNGRILLGSSRVYWLLCMGLSSEANRVA